MAVTNGWGQGVINNTNGWGKLATNNIGAGSVYENSASGDTALIGTSAAFSYSASSFTQADADPTPTITGTTGGTFSGTSGLVFVSTSTGEIDLSASTIAAHVVTYTVGGVSSNFNLSVIAAPFASTQSFNFDGVDDFMQLSSAISITNQFSLSFWIKPDGFGSSSFVLTDNPSATFLRLSSASLIQFKISGTLLQFSDSGNNLVDGVWQHLFIYRDSSNSIKILRNGTSFASSINNSNTLVISTIANVLSFFFSGSLDEISFFNTDQSANISSIYNSGVPNDISSLNPVAWYRMGENANYKSPQWLMPENSNKDKFSNYSFQFDGVDDYVDAGNNSSLRPTSAFAISFWMNGVGSGDDFVFRNGAPADLSNNSGFGFRVLSGANDYRFVLGDGSSNTSLNVSGVLTGWNHFLLNWNGSTMEMFINGVSQGSSSFTGSISYSTGNFLIGDRNTSGSKPYIGNIDEVAVWNSDQSSNVSSIYNSGDPTTITGAVAHWKMGEEATFSTNWSIPDQVGSNDGTSNNMTIEDRIGDSPNSTNNSVSFNMVEADRETDVPT